ncbi:MAG TPA: hypothetical protein VFH06_04565 [Candidatus Saccharimonadales bacterium]|nr:hypothetical protein [Candidatus Saccharimonadales bacterium]
MSNCIRDYQEGKIVTVLVCNRRPPSWVVLTLGSPYVAAISRLPLVP